MKTKSDNREVSVGDQRKTHLSDTLEFLIEDVQRKLMTLIDLSIAMERERVRLDEVGSKDKIEVDEVRVITALLTVFCGEVGRLKILVTEGEDIFQGVLSENGVNPIVPETWCRAYPRQ